MAAAALTLNEDRNLFDEDHEPWKAFVTTEHVAETWTSPVCLAKEYPLEDTVCHYEYDEALFPIDGVPSEIEFAHERRDTFEQPNLPRDLSSIGILPDSSWNSLLEFPPPLLDPTHDTECVKRPIGYEDKRDKGKATNTDRHPQYYATNWDALSAFTPPPDAPSPLQSMTTLSSEMFNIRASNIDRGLSDGNIRAFFRARCRPIECIHMETLASQKVVYLAINEDSAQQDAIALDGCRLGRYHVTVEWHSGIFSGDLT